MTLLPVNLPTGAMPKVSVGDKISQGDIIAKNQTFVTDEIIHLSKDFDILPKDIERSLKKNLGDSIKAGDLIAIKKKAFGGKKILSKISGTLTKIDNITGDLYIKTDGSGLTEDIISPVDGIIDFCNNEKIVIKTQKNTILAKEAFGVGITAEILVKNLVLGNIGQDINDKVIVTQNLDKVSLFKSLGLGAKGIITVNLEDIDFSDFSDQLVNDAILIVEEKDFDKLKKQPGKKIIADIKSKLIIIL
jgi:hypothetical protein